MDTHNPDNVSRHQGHFVSTRELPKLDTAALLAELRDLRKLVRDLSNDLQEKDEEIAQLKQKVADLHSYIDQEGAV